MKLYIVQIKLNSDYTISVELSNGHWVIYDMSNKKETARFADVFADGIFDEAQLIDGRVIRWNKSMELSLEEILLEINRVY